MDFKKTAKSRRHTKVFKLSCPPNFKVKKPYTLNHPYKLQLCPLNHLKTKPRLTDLLSEYASLAHRNLPQILL